MGKIKAVIFDWDGVIVDSRDAILEINQRIVKHFNGRPFEDFENFRKRFVDWREFYRNLAPHNPNAIDDATKIFKSEMKEFLPKIKLYENIDVVLRQLSKKYSLGIVSHNLRDLIESKLRENGLIQLFNSIVDGTVENRKPHPEPINICLSELDVEPHEACMIGDTVEDLKAARNANLAKFIGTLYGFSPAKELKESDFTVRTPEEILKAVEAD